MWTATLASILGFRRQEIRLTTGRAKGFAHALVPRLVRARHMTFLRIYVAFSRLRRACRKSHLLVLMSLASRPPVLSGSFWLEFVGFQDPNSPFHEPRSARHDPSLRAAPP